MVRGDFFGPHVARLWAVYRERRDVMLAAMAQHFPPEVRWTRPQGGLFLWVTLPPSLDATSLLEEALRHQVVFGPGTPFHADGSGRHTMRFNFSYSHPEQIETGIRRLSEVLTQVLARVEA